MCNNRILTAAIATALCMNAGQLQAAASFENAGTTHISGGATSGAPIPLAALTADTANATYDFTSTTIIKVPPSDPDKGIAYALELFGDDTSSLVLPCTDDTYMAAVYTIDGIAQSTFTAKFTLTGAKFSDAKLGIADYQSYVDTTADAYVDAPGVRVDTDDSAGSPITIAYDDGGTGGTAGAITVGNVLRFGPAGAEAPVALLNAHTAPNLTLETGNAYGGLTASVTDNMAIYSAAVPGSNTGITLATVSGATGSDITITTSAAISGLAIGDVLVFDTGGTFKAIAVVKAVSPAIILDFVTNGITVGDNISYIAASTFVQIDNIAVNAPDGVAVGGTDVFYDDGTSGGKGADLSGEITSTNKIRFVNAYTGPKAVASATAIAPATGANNSKIPVNALAEAVPDNADIFLLNSAAGADKGDWTDASSPSSPRLNPTGIGTSAVTFDLNTTGTNQALATGDELMLAYKLKDVECTEVGDEIKMTVEMITAGAQSTIVQPSREIVVANCKEALTVSMDSIDEGTAKISVAADNKEFTGTAASANGVDSPYLSPTEVQIGTISIIQATNVKACDGLNGFTISTDTDQDGYTEGSTLKIIDGQFAASKTSPGKVLINVQGGGSYEASTVDDTEASWDLTNTQLADIATQTSPPNNNNATIRIQADTTSQINLGGENNPSAELNIDFKKVYVKDITAESDLTKIAQDGTTCRIYNIPRSGKADEMSIRIINRSSVGGTVTASVYDKAGGTPTTGSLNGGEPIAPGAALAVTPADLEALGATWTGRAMLVLRSTLPKMEVLALIRQSAPAGEPNDNPQTNLSVGAHGSNCSN